MAVLYLAFALILVTLLLYKLRNVGQRPPGYPPGPPTLPVIGNLHLMSGKHPHHQFKKWADEYGPVYSLILGSRVVVVLSSPQAVRDLLDKRSAIYSSRPDMYIGNLTCDGNRILFEVYGNEWRQYRRILHNIPYQDLESKSMLAAMLDEPQSVFQHVRRYSTSLSTQMIYGFRMERHDDPRLHKLFRIVDKVTEVVGAQAAALLDVFPILQSLPAFMSPLYHHARALNDEAAPFYLGLYLDAKKKVKGGLPTAPPFIASLVKAQETENISDDNAAWIATTGLEGGSDTTASTLAGFVQAMVLFPEAQKKAQEAIDRVCGDRMPEMSDMDNKKAHYIRACAKETLRWMPTAILGMPHAVTQADEYMGYKIPKGATVVCNVWALHTDPVRYPNPRTFDPSRYASDFQSSSDAARAADVTQRDHFGFGTGRRICQGMHIADRSMFLAIARAPYGREITPDPDDLTSGLVVEPRPFPLKITPRSELRAALVRRAWKECQVSLDAGGQWREVPEGVVTAARTGADSLVVTRAVWRG
ncbi:cytochrome P450 [Podospora appendiculata]|uniref:Cytochrome P450 n=1 Tax=Podospora appendiculata TaxID=314037 RepID=A0AAE0X6Y7_9PEZI|nr:cytochrome P450 [Podospora appendiculata]